MHQSSAAESTLPTQPRPDAPAGRRGPWPGLLLSAALGACGLLLGRIPWFSAHGLSALTLAILLGIMVGNTFYARIGDRCGPGVNLAKQTVLRLGIVLYGLRLTLQDVGHVGLVGVAIDAVMLGSTFALAVFIGRRWLGLDRETAVLIGAGNAICGAAAVIATEPVVRAKAEQVTVAVATVVVFGTVATFLYPVLFVLNTHWALIPGGTSAFGVYAGSTIHEVAQVVAAARAIDPAVADTAVIAKMVRVMMLAPFLLLVSYGLSRIRKSGGAGHASQRAWLKSVPWFALGFVGVVLFNSLHWVPAPWLRVVNDFDTGLLAMAMGALGLTTHAGAIRKAGLKPLLMALILFVWLVFGGALVNRTLAALLA